MSENQFTQAYELVQLQRKVKEYAKHMRERINGLTADSVNGEGLKSNLLALVDVWQHQKLADIQSDFDAL